jgi:hypothetical protein
MQADAASGSGIERSGLLWSVENADHAAAFCEGAGRGVGSLVSFFCQGEGRGFESRRPLTVVRSPSSAHRRPLTDVRSPTSAPQKLQVRATACG